MKFFLVIFCGVALLSCSDDGFRDRYELGPARILGLVLSNPEINPGESTTLQPIVSFEDQTSETFEHRLRTCADPGLEYGVDPTCETATDTTLVLDWTTLSFTNPEQKTEFLATLATITAPSTFLDESSDVEKIYGKIILVEYSLRVNGSEIKSSFARLRVSDPTLKPIKNTNPVVSDILLDESPITARPESLKGNLAVSFDASSLAEGEELLTSYYVSQGTVEYARTLGSQTTEWELTTEESTQATALTVVAVGRDENGGLAVQIRNGL